MKALGILQRNQFKKVMLACYKDNISSRKTIEKCGGILEKEFALYELRDLTFYTENLSDNVIQVFWIIL